MKKRYKYNFFFWKNQKGSAIVSTLISVALLGISGAGLLQYINNFQQTTGQTLERVNVDPLIRAMVINNMRSLLIEKDVKEDGSKSKQNRYGICSILHKPRRSHGVRSLKISFQNKSSFNVPRWQVFFPKMEWEIMNTSDCRKIDKDFSEGSFSRCFKYTKKTEEADDIIMLFAQIIPRKFPSLEEIDVSQTSNTYDPEQVVFQLKTAVSVYSAHEDYMSDQGQDPNDPGARGKSTSYISYQSDVLWTDAVGECHIQAADGNWAVVSLSATGPGSDLRNRVVNNLSYSGDIPCGDRVTLFDINDDVVQMGRTDNAVISSYLALNARVACTKNKFSCRQTIKTEALEPSTYDSLQFSFNILNADFSYLPINNFNVTLKKSNGREVDGTDNEKLDGVSISFYHSRASSTPIETNADIDYNLLRGSGLVAVSSDTSDVAQSEKLASYCHDICQSYNTGSASTYVYPAVNIHEKKIGSEPSCSFTKDYSASASNRVQCIVCHTKSCHRYGLGTFGPLDNELRTVQIQNMPPSQHTVYGMSDEPFDGQLPECVVANSYELTPDVRKIPDGVRGSGESAVAAGSCKAMAMRVNNNNAFGNLKDNTYEETNCNTQLPVLCFTSGHYLPALEINTNNLNDPYRVVTAKFQDAEEACLNIGREVGQYYQLGVIMANAYKIEFASTNFVARTVRTLKQLPLLAGTGNKNNISITTPGNEMFNFVNNASRGIFLAPTAYDQSYFKLTEQMSKILTATFNTFGGGSKKVWTAMEWDAEGLVVASPPWALVAKGDPFALFYDKREDKGNRLVVLKDTGSYAASKYFALTYNLRWKGLVPWAANKSLPFVCKNETTDLFFITSSTGNLSAGPARCKTEGGLFVPPESGLDWSKLMLDLNPNDDYYPFPDPVLDPADVENNSFVYKKKLNAPKAWVALQKITGTKAPEKKSPRASELKLYSGHFPNSDSVFSKDSKENILEALFNADRFTDADVKSRYMQVPIAVMTTSGLVPEPSGNLLLSGIFGLIVELFKVNDIDVDNAHSKTKLSLTGYKKICLAKERDELIPASVHNLGSACPNGGVTMDIGNSLASSAKFKPTSYKYMSYWIKDIGISDTEYVAVTGGKLEERVNAYNDKIDCLIGCDDDCTSEWNSCYSACPPCVNETYTGTCTGERPVYDPNDPLQQIQTGTESYDYDCEQTRLNCDDRNACRSDCDDEKTACRNDCNSSCDSYDF